MTESEHLVPWKVQGLVKKGAVEDLVEKGVVGALWSSLRKFLWGFSSQKQFEDQLEKDGKKETERAVRALTALTSRKLIEDNIIDPGVANLLSYEDLWEIAAELEQRKLSDEAEGGAPTPEKRVIKERMKSSWKVQTAGDMPPSSVDLFLQAIRGSMTPEMLDECEVPSLLKLLEAQKILPSDVQLLRSLEGGVGPAFGKLIHHHLQNFERLVEHSLIVLIDAKTGGGYDQVVHAGGGAPDGRRTRQGEILLKLIEAGRHLEPSSTS